MAAAAVEVAIEADFESSVSAASIDDADLALQGITMLLNNNWKEAEEMFAKHKDYSPLMNSGNSFVKFMQGLMTFEDEKLAEALKDLQETEKKCESSDGFFKGIKKKLKKKKSESAVMLEDRLQRQIIVGDSILYQAVLTFINQDLTSYVKGGWLLRRAWKVYEKTHKEIKDKYDAVCEGSEINKDIENGNTNVSSSAVNHAEDNGTLSKETLHRLLGAISFGYGSFQLVISMMPPKILKIIEFLGFEGDRDIGLSSLDFASHSKDMKAPLATLGLLQYHTVIRPFFAVDGSQVDAGVEDAANIMERCEKDYPDSALFLFFKARILRLQCKLDESLATYQTALESCSEQREIQLVCYHEIGWCNLMKMNWRESLTCFVRLKEESRWSKSYYAYLTAVCQGAMGDVKGAAATFKEVPGLVKKKNNQIEAFSLRRAEKFKKVKPTQEFCVLLALEVLYLWNAFPSCKKSDIEKMLEECNNQNDKKIFHMRSLIEGALFRAQGDDEMSIQCFEEAIARHQGMKDDNHVPAFANYELGSMWIQKPETYAKGKKCLNQAKDNYKDYDFENRLNVRIHIALKKMKEEGTPL